MTNFSLKWLEKSSEKLIIKLLEKEKCSLSEKFLSFQVVFVLAKFLV